MVVDYLKRINAQQAIVTHDYINTNEKLRRTNAVICFNKIRYP